MKNFILFFCAAVIGTIVVIGYINISSGRGIAAPQNTSEIGSPNFSVENAPSQSIKGNIISMSGEVNWQSRIATDSAKLNAPRQIQQGEQINTGDTGIAEVEFKGFTSLKILSKSEVNFVQTLPANFVIAQNKGNVTYTNSSATHLSIRYLHLLIDMEAGQISVKINQSKPIVDIVVTDGQLTVAYNDLENISQEKTFTKGQDFIFNDTTRKLAI